MVYDYRINTKNFNDLAIQLDNLSVKQLQKVAEAVEEIKESDDEIYRTNTKIYFHHAILPILQDFAELTGSILIIEENNPQQIIEVIFKNSCGFDITENYKYIKTLFILANHIGINFEDNEMILSLIFNLQNLH